MSPAGHHSPPQAAQAPRGIVPPFLLTRLAGLDDPRFAQAAKAARLSLVRDRPLRQRRAGAAPRPAAVDPRGARLVAGTPGTVERSIGDAANEENLAGRLVRSEGDPPTRDPAVDEAYDGLGATYDLFWQVYGRDSVDGRGLPLAATVHYGQLYDNAFWAGDRLVFGDGDGEVFNRFTIALTIIAHELTHGVTELTAGLSYEGQSGALNESVSDVFGSLVEQYSRRQTAARATWLIGEGLFTDQVGGRALRSLKEPGTAFDDDVLGKDPQPGSMAGYVETDDDSGGVHINSGIPNRAFYLVADSLGGNAWDSAGRIWYDTLTGGRLSPTVDFAGFAAATEATAAALFGQGSTEHSAVAAAWATVGVRAMAAPRPAE